jgi:fumarate reductase flavoprotein subunit
MDKNDSNLTRRKFIAAGSAAIAAPLVMSMAGRVTEAMAEEKKTYYINDNCVLCSPLPCKVNCPANAIYFDGEHMAINPDKCIRCGTCYEKCNISAVVDLSIQPAPPKPHEQIKRDCDILIVGGGASGLVAAGIAAELSGKKIIVLEKAKKAGGSGMYPLGFQVSNSKWQLDAGATDTTEARILSAMNTTNWELNPRLVSNAIRALPAFFDWFCTWSKPEEIYTMNKDTKSIELKDQFKVRCVPVMKRLIDNCKKLGVEILTEYAATDFIMGDKGEITGVKAKDPGGTTIFTCKACLVAAGNVLNCSTLIERCAPDYAHVAKRRTGHYLSTNSGDGVLMAERAGIPVDYNNICITYTSVNSTLGETQARHQQNRGETLYINLNGKRWINETSTSTRMLRKQPKCMYYSIMDSKILTMDRSAFTSAGGGMGGGMPGGPGGGASGSGAPGGGSAAGGTPAGGMGRGATNVPAGAEIMGSPFWEYEIREKADLKELQRIAALPGRHVVIADTIEELADKMGVDQKAFVATVKRYNELCSKGHDDDYYKSKTYMVPIEKGPFYAFSAFLGNDGVVGGLNINENMQVMGHDGPVKGLYASGDMTGNHFSNRGGERTEFLPDMSWAVASGWVAGEHIGKQLKKVDM